MTDLTFNVSLSDLLRAVVEVDWIDERTVTMGELVAREVAAELDITQAVKDEMQAQVRAQVEALVQDALNAPPRNDSSLTAMILAEAKRQLTPNPDQYRGSSTPMAAYIAGEVYQAIREPALEMVGRIKAEADEAVRRTVRDQLGRL